MSGPAYDRLGRGYERHRRADPRIAAQITAALGDARSLLDVGAGTGSYEPRDRRVVALEPSAVMIGQRPRDAAPVVRAVAEALPFGDGSFDAALAVLTVHHWLDPARGLAEMRRVARRRVLILTWAPEVFARSFWFARDYVPEVFAAERALVTLGHVVAALPGCRVAAVPVPHDCRDGFFGAYWRRPEAYLDPDVRGAISALARIGEERLGHAVQRLADDLRSGAWHRRYAELALLDALDLGYRLVTLEAGGPTTA